MNETSLLSLHLNELAMNINWKAPRAARAVRVLTVFKKTKHYLLFYHPYLDSNALFIL